MKKTKVIIPALGLLLLSTAASVTGTVAWFAANSSVTATGMKVKAKSDNEFLQIAAASATWNDTDPFTTVEINNTTAKEIKPTHVAASLAEGGASYTNYAGSTSAIVWLDARSNNVANAAHSGAFTNVTASATTDYTLLNELKVRIKPGTAASASNFRVSSVAFAAVEQSGTDVTDGLINSLRVLVVGADAGVVWKNGSYVEGATNSIVDAEVDTTGANVSVYVYFDGEDESCYTNNAITPDDYTVSITFAVGALA